MAVEKMDGCTEHGFEEIREMVKDRDVCGGWIAKS